jgi:putative salt-induced outer membrane protein YdiY
MILLLIAIASLIGMKNTGPSPKPIPLHLELDAGVLAVSGKNKTQTFNTGLDARYDFGRNTLNIYGDYLKASTESVDSALHWTAGARYEYEFMERTRAYLDYYAEADPFIGYVQRDNEGTGVQYLIHRDETLSWWAELGYLHSHTVVKLNGSVYESKAHAAMKASWIFARSWSLDGRFEYLFNLTHGDQDLMDYEVAVTTLLNSTLSLRTAYLMRYMETAYIGSRYQSTTTLSFVASF